MLHRDILCHGTTVCVCVCVCVYVCVYVCVCVWYVCVMNMAYKTALVYIHAHVRFVKQV